MKTNQRTLISHHRPHWKIDTLFQRAKLLYNHSLFYPKQRYIFKGITLQFIHSHKDKSWKDDVIPLLERRNYYKDLWITVQYALKEVPLGDKKVQVKDKDNKDKTIKVKTLLQDWIEITEKEFLKQLKLLFESNLNKDYRFISYQSLYKEIYSLPQSHKLYSSLPPKVAPQVGGFWTSLRSFKIPLKTYSNKQSKIWILSNLY